MLSSAIQTSSSSEEQITASKSSCGYMCWWWYKKTNELPHQTHPAAACESWWRECCGSSSRSQREVFAAPTPQIWGRSLFFKWFGLVENSIWLEIKMDFTFRTLKSASESRWILSRGDFSAAHSAAKKFICQIAQEKSFITLSGVWTTLLVLPLSFILGTGLQFN